MKNIRNTFIIIFFLLICSTVFAQGRFIGDVWIPDSALTASDFNFSNNVGIGTTVPGGKLGIKSTGTTTGITIQTRDSTGAIKITAQDSGNVGIGSSVPQGKLDIVGADTLFINQTSAGGILTKFTCTEGGSTVAPATATSSTQLKTCTCYVSTVANKVGAVKVNINGVDRWIQIFDNPN